MIVGVVVCPAAPWLIDAVAPTLATDPAVAAAAIRPEVTDLAARCDRILAVVPASRGSAEGWIPAVADDLGPSPYGRGADADAATGTDASTTPLPGAAWVARALLGDGPLDVLALPSVSRDAATPLPGQVIAIAGDAYRWGLLVLADGARCHGDDAPAARDARADNFERRLAGALATGDPEVLGRWVAAERELGDELGATAAVLLGVPAALLASAAPEPFRADGRYLCAPFGVGYHLASWRR